MLEILSLFEIMGGNTSKKFSADTHIFNNSNRTVRVKITRGRDGLKKTTKTQTDTNIFGVAKFGVDETKQVESTKKQKSVVNIKSNHVHQMKVVDETVVMSAHIISMKKRISKAKACKGLKLEPGYTYTIMYDSQLKTASVENRKGTKSDKLKNNDEQIKTVSGTNKKGIKIDKSKLDDVQIETLSVESEKGIRIDTPNKLKSRAIKDNKS